MAKARPYHKRGALRPIPIEPPTTASFEAAAVLALHNGFTEAQVLEPVSDGLPLGGGGDVVVGSQTGSKMNIRGGTFSPRSTAKFI